MRPDHKRTIPAPRSIQPSLPAANKAARRQQILLPTLLAVLLTASPHLQAARPESNPSQSQNTTVAALQQMAARADVVFVGHILAIHLPASYVGSPEDAAEGIVEIVFQIDVPIRGTTPSGQYRLREWSGLWVGGSQRYRVGQRLLVLLHAPNAAGLSSPIDGTDGLLPLIGLGPTPSPTDTTTTPGTLAVDLRWVQTRLLRQVNLTGQNPANPNPIAPNPITPDPITPQPAAPEPIHPEPTPPEPIFPNPVRSETTGSELNQSEPNQSEPNGPVSLIPAITSPATLNRRLVPLPQPRLPWRPTPPLTSEAQTAALADVLAVLKPNASPAINANAIQTSPPSTENQPHAPR